jgi:hypothetical protein
LIKEVGEAVLMGFVLGDLPPIAPITHKFLRDDLWSFAANISELFGPLEKPPLAALPFFLGC